MTATSVLRKIAILINQQYPDHSSISGTSRGIAQLQLSQLPKELQNLVISHQNRYTGKCINCTLSRNSKDDRRNSEVSYHDIMSQLCYWEFPEKLTLVCPRLTYYLQQSPDLSVRRIIAYLTRLMCNDVQEQITLESLKVYLKWQICHQLITGPWKNIDRWFSQLQFRVRPTQYTRNKIYWKIYHFKLNVDQRDNSVSSHHSDDAIKKKDYYIEIPSNLQLISKVHLHNLLTVCCIREMLMHNRALSDDLEDLLYLIYQHHLTRLIHRVYRVISQYNPCEWRLQLSQCYFNHELSQEYCHRLIQLL